MLSFTKNPDAGYYHVLASSARATERIRAVKIIMKGGENMMVERMMQSKKVR